MIRIEGKKALDKWVRKQFDKDEDGAILSFRAEVEFDRPIYTLYAVLLKSKDGIFLKITKETPLSLYTIVEPSMDYQEVIYKWNSLLDKATLDYAEKIGELHTRKLFVVPIL